MAPAIVDAVGATGAILTTVCWVPQAVKIIRDRDTFFDETHAQTERKLARE